MIVPDVPRSYELHETLVSIKGLGVTIDDKPVLYDVNAEVRDIVRPGCVTGQIVGILGPSGVGKTVFSKVLAGLRPATTGAVTVGPDARPVEAGLVGYVPQNYPLFPHRTVLGNLVRAARSTGVDRKTAKERAEAYLRRFELSDRAGAYPAELSGGQRQRIAIAQQLLSSEHYLILDEPTTGLDLLMKDKVCDLIRQVSSLSEENTVFLVSHDVPVTLSLADHLWLLGRVRDERGVSRGAQIVRRYDLIERGLAWHPKPSELPQFNDLLREIRAGFDTL
ncbi:MAG: ATP-binding cassette domain-containing protein [Polyangiales bacterium]